MSEYPAWVTATTLEVCARTGLAAGHRQERPTLPGTDLCGPCHARFPRILGDLVHYWQPLHDAVIRKPARDPMQDRVAGGTPNDVGSMWNPAAQATINLIADWTGFVIRTLANEHPGGSPVQETTRTDIAIAAIARWEARWLTHHPDLGASLLDDAIDMRGKAMRAVDTAAPAFKRVILRGHHCADTVADTEWGPVECGGQLIGLIRPQENTAWQGQKPSVIVCGTDPTHTRLELKDWITA